jgi:acetyl-CoA carboxylase biotin carboxylase subunit
VQNSFDSMVAKVVSYGSSREEARLRMLVALKEFRLTGFPTSIPFHLQVLEHPEFIAGNLSTHFLGDHFPKFQPQSIPTEVAKLLALAVAADSQTKFASAPASNGATVDAWKQSARVGALR